MENLEELSSERDARIDRERFEKRHPESTKLIGRVRATLDIPRPKERVQSSEQLSMFRWIQNRFRMFFITEMCPPRCIHRCRELCKNPWMRGKALPLGFCICKKCCPCCGVVH